MYTIQLKTTDKWYSKKEKKYYPKKFLSIDDSEYQKIKFLSRDDIAKKVAIANGLSTEDVTTEFKDEIEIKFQKILKLYITKQFHFCIGRELLMIAKVDTKDRQLSIAEEIEERKYFFEYNKLFTYWNERYAKIFLNPVKSIHEVKERNWDMKSTGSAYKWCTDENLKQLIYLEKELNKIKKIKIELIHDNKLVDFIIIEFCKYSKKIIKNFYNLDLITNNDIKHTIENGKRALFGYVKNKKYIFGKIEKPSEIISKIHQYKDYEYHTLRNLKIYRGKLTHTFSYY